MPYPLYNECCGSSLPVRCSANYLADCMKSSPRYRQEETERWDQAINSYQEMIHKRDLCCTSPPNSPITMRSLRNIPHSGASSSGDSPPHVDEKSIGSSLMGYWLTAVSPSMPVQSSEPKLVLSSAPIIIPNCIADLTGCTQSVPLGLGATSGPIHLSHSQPIPTIGRRRRYKSADHEQLLGTFHASCPYSQQLECSEYRSFPSLNKVSSKNRSLHGTNPQSRGETSLELEAVAAVHELSMAVQTISVSEILPRTPELIFVNVTTVEGQPYCLELTMKGWRVTSLRHDCMHGDYRRMELFTTYYDSLNQLMDELSPGYRDVFNQKLTQKLRILQLESEGDLAASALSLSATPIFDRGSDLHLPISSIDEINCNNSDDNSQSPWKSNNSISTCNG